VRQTGLTRQTLRGMKRAIHAGAQVGAKDSSVLMGRESALSLLCRSIGFGHRRLALVRLVIAVRSGATVLPEHWHYCHQAAHVSEDAWLQVLYLSAAQQARVQVADLAAAQ
jgi:hypothetical protein